MEPSYTFIMIVHTELVCEDFTALHLSLSDKISVCKTLRTILDGVNVIIN